MRRLFIIRKDLHLSAGKLAAMVGHCCEAYWTNMLKRYESEHGSSCNRIHEDCNGIWFNVSIPHDVWHEYVNGIFTKTICEAKNLYQLKKVEDIIEEYNISLDYTGNGRLIQGIDWGFINDNCLTELTPENPDGTTTVGVWFGPLKDETAHFISRKYKLYRD